MVFILWVIPLLATHVNTIIYTHMDIERIHSADVLVVKSNAVWLFYVDITFLKGIQHLLERNKFMMIPKVR